jgi:hypothetical protein
MVDLSDNPALGGDGTAELAAAMRALPPWAAVLLPPLAEDAPAELL